MARTHSGGRLEVREETGLGTADEWAQSRDVGSVVSRKMDSQTLEYAERAKFDRALALGETSKALARDSEHLLEQLQSSGRARARRKLLTEPDRLSDYETRLLGDEWFEHQARERTKAAAQQAAEEKRARVISVLRPAGIVFRSPELKALNEHAIELACKFGVTCVRASADNASATMSTKTVAGPPVTNHKQYAVFLHELGHLVEPDADGRQHRYDTAKDGTLLSPNAEIAAWKFALHVARVWYADMHNHLAYGLASYSTHATPSERKAMATMVRESARKVTDRTLAEDKVTEQVAFILDGELTAAKHEPTVTSDGLETELSKLREQVKALSERPEIAYCGTHVEGEQYRAGSLVTRSGSLWCATGTTKATPGTGEGWRLVVKQGRA